MKYQQENFQGSFDFRCNLHDGWNMDTHLHEYCELLYCRKGCCEVLLDGKRICLPEKHLLWLPPNCIHQYPDIQAQVVCAVFSRDFIPLFFRFSGDRRLKPQPVAMEELSGILDRFYVFKNENPMVISGYLNLICAKVLKEAQWESGNQADSILYQKVISYLSAHFCEDITLKSIAREFGYNEKYLSHALHSLTAMHFSKLLALYRIDYAKTLLADPETKIVDIAGRCGFSALNSFNRTFKEITGVTPTQYRKNRRII